MDENANKRPKRATKKSLKALENEETIKMYKGQVNIKRKINVIEEETIEEEEEEAKVKKSKRNTLNRKRKAEEHTSPDPIKLKDKVEEKPEKKI